MKKNNEKVEESCRNSTWNYNHIIIRDSYVKLIDRLIRRPTYPEIAKDSGLSETTIQKHIEELEFRPHPLRILTDDVILSIYNVAKAGNVQAQKLWLQVVEGWSERQHIEHSGFTPTLVELVKKYQDQKNNEK